MNPYSMTIRALMPWVGLFTRSRFWSLYRRYRQRPLGTLFALTPEQTLGNIQPLVRHAYEHVPFYRERMQTLGLVPEDIQTLEGLQALPPTTKADVEAHFPDRITSNQQDVANWRFVSTSGTTQRLTVVQDFHKRDVSRAAQMLALDLAAGYRAGMKYMEIPPDICQHVCGTNGTQEPDIIDYFIENLKARRIFKAEVKSDLRGLVERQLIYRRVQLPSLSPDGIRQKPEILDNYLQQIDAYRPHVVKALPVYLYLLARHILATNRKPPRITGKIMPMGSSMSPYMREVIQLAFDCNVSEDYGSSELGGIAAECEWHNGLHPFTGLFHVEVVRHGKPVKEGEVGRVLITDLHNYAMPLIRYDIGDVAAVMREPCRCGIPHERLVMHGRVQDAFVKSDHGIVTSDHITDLVLSQPGVLAFQVEFSDRDDPFIQIVPNQGKLPSIEQISRKLSDLLGDSIRIRGRLVATIQPESGGKYRFVKNQSTKLAELI